MLLYASHLSKADFEKSFRTRREIVAWAMVVRIVEALSPTQPEGRRARPRRKARGGGPGERELEARY